MVKKCSSFSNLLNDLKIGIKKWLDKFNNDWKWFILSLCHQLAFAQKQIPKTHCKIKMQPQCSNVTFTGTDRNKMNNEWKRKHLPTCKLRTLDWTIHLMPVYKYKLMHHQPNSAAKKSTTKKQAKNRKNNCWYIRFLQSDIYYLQFWIKLLMDFLCFRHFFLSTAIAIDFTLDIDSYRLILLPFITFLFFQQQKRQFLDNLYWRRCY